MNILGYRSNQSRLWGQFLGGILNLDSRRSLPWLVPLALFLQHLTTHRVFIIKGTLYATSFAATTCEGS